MKSMSLISRFIIILFISKFFTSIIIIWIIFLFIDTHKIFFHIINIFCDTTSILSMIIHFFLLSIGQIFIFRYFKFITLMLNSRIHLIVFLTIVHRLFSFFKIFIIRRGYSKIFTCSDIIFHIIITIFIYNFRIILLWNSIILLIIRKIICWNENIFSFIINLALIMWWSFSTSIRNLFITVSIIKMFLWLITSI
jgi:hypothetical protein